MSIKKKLNLLFLFTMIPFLLLITVFLLMMNRYNNAYSGIVRNVTTASAFNQDFKENVDSKMYLVVVGNGTIDKLDPYREINEAEALVKKLIDSASTTESQEIIRNNQRYLTNLRKYVQEIGQRAAEPGNYSKNMASLDGDIRILTDLVEENMSSYIYYETQSLSRTSQEMNAQVRGVITAAIIVSVLTAAAVFLIMYRITDHSIVRPIHALCEDAHSVGRGDFTTRASEEEGDEIKTLSHSFNRMVEKIGSLVEDVKLEQLNLRGTELKLLQAQINPHFLYNTLDTIIWLAEDKQDEKVIEMVKSLSDFFRISLSQGRDFITLSEEQLHVESYLKIQQFRYRDILRYEIVIPGELGGFRILKLTLQPLVENALYHGIKQKRGMGLIRIEGRMDGKNIVLTVRDNGCGMSADELERVRNAIYNRRENGETAVSFGLFNVHERIRLHFGEAYGLTLTSKPGEGTAAEVTIPASD